MALITLGFSPFIMLGGVMMSRLHWKKNIGGKSTEEKEDPY